MLLSVNFQKIPIDYQWNSKTSGISINVGNVLVVKMSILIITTAANLLMPSIYNKQGHIYLNKPAHKCCYFV